MIQYDGVKWVCWKYFLFKNEFQLGVGYTVNGGESLCALSSSGTPPTTCPYSRVCGTFKERTGWHSCQMPEQVLGRMIKVSSNPGEVVLDPFLGSGSTACVAKKLDRRYFGFELSADYLDQIQNRLDNTSIGDPLTGTENPLYSVPTTDRGRKL